MPWCNPSSEPWITDLINPAAHRDRAGCRNSVYDARFGTFSHMHFSKSHATFVVYPQPLTSADLVPAADRTLIGAMD